MTLHVMLSLLAVILLIVAIAFFVRKGQARLQKYTKNKFRIHVFHPLTAKHKVVKFSDAAHEYTVLLGEAQSLLLHKASHPLEPALEDGSSKEEA